MSYGKVHEGFWESDRIGGLSDGAALLALFLLTGPHRNAIGCFRLGVGAISDVPRFNKWGVDKISSYLDELCSKQFLIRDTNKGWMLIDKALEKDPIKGEKAAKHALSLSTSVPRKSAIFESLRVRLEPQLVEFSEALSDKDGWPMERACDAPSNGDAIPHASPSPLPEPSQDPEPVKPSADADGPPNKPGAVEVDEVEAAVEAWNAFAERHGLAKVQRITAKRRSACKIRLTECDGLDGFVNGALPAIARSPFLLGENDRGWKADFDFLMQQKSFTKLMEGGYDRSKPTRPNGSDAHTAQASAFASVAAGFDDHGGDHSDAGEATPGTGTGGPGLLEPPGNLDETGEPGLDLREGSDASGALCGGQCVGGDPEGSSGGLAGEAEGSPGPCDPASVPGLAGAAERVQTNAGGDSGAGLPSAGSTPGRTAEAAGPAAADPLDGMTDFPPIPVGLDRRAKKETAS
ncbi:hypothetical protein [Pelagibius sp.]|uniref:hypothetical protein n=1 Tax=Pelagibius sp. TaxID=1931238 RepID=UPI003BB1D3E6